LIKDGQKCGIRTVNLKECYKFFCFSSGEVKFLTFLRRKNKINRNVKDMKDVVSKSAKGKKNQEV
jgi:hypothetical protein